MGSVSASAIGGVRGSNFLVLGLGQRQAERTVQTGPVINGQAPPTEGRFGILSPRKSQRAPDRMGIHAASSAVAPFNRRGVWGGVAQLLQATVDAPLGAMHITPIDFDHTLPLPMLDDLHMGQRPRNAVAHVGKAPAVPLTREAIGLSENLRE
jgi:hypothetical protein